MEIKREKSTEQEQESQQEAQVVYANIKELPQKMVVNGHELSTSAALNVTKGASLRLREILDEENDEKIFPRVMVMGGGCSGMKYGFILDDEIEEDDVALPTEDNVSIVLDTQTLELLSGATIDFKDDVYGGEIIINNINSTSSCSCGKSFCG